MTQYLLYLLQEGVCDNWNAVGFKCD